MTDELVLDPELTKITLAYIIASREALLEAHADERERLLSYDKH